jgi:hypothetical protein
MRIVNALVQFPHVEVQRILGRNLSTHAEAPAAD